jgi:hypothetical protein
MSIIKTIRIKSYFSNDFNTMVRTSSLWSLILPMILPQSSSGCHSNTHQKLIARKQKLSHLRRPACTISRKQILLICPSRMVLQNLSMAAGLLRRAHGRQSWGGWGRRVPPSFWSGGGRISNYPPTFWHVQLKFCFLVI